MGYVYVVTKTTKCDECELPDPNTLHYSQAGTIFQCDICTDCHELKVGRRGSKHWMPIDKEKVEKIINSKKKKVSKTKV